MQHEKQARALLEEIAGLRRASRELLSLLIDIDRRHGAQLGEGKDSILPVAALLKVDASLQEVEELARQFVKRANIGQTKGHHGAEELIKMSFILQIARTAYIAIRDGIEFWLRDG